MASKSPKPVDKIVGTRIRMQRRKRGLTIQKLADAVGIAYRQLHKYETGENRVSASRLQQIALALEVTPAFFFDKAPGAKARAPAELKEFVSSVEGVALSQAFMKIADERIRWRIVTLVERIAQAKAKTHRKEKSSTATARR